MRRRAQITVNQHFGALDRRLRAYFSSGYGDLPLPKPVKGAMLSSKPPGIWRMSAQSPGLSAFWVAESSRLHGIGGSVRARSWSRH